VDARDKPGQNPWFYWLDFESDSEERALARVSMDEATAIHQGQPAGVMAPQNGSWEIVPSNQRVLHRFDCAQESARSCGINSVFWIFWKAPPPDFIRECAVPGRDYRVKP
jgi:hypothetical protein